MREIEQKTGAYLVGAAGTGAIMLFALANVAAWICDFDMGWIAQAIALLAGVVFGLYLARSE